MKRWPTKKLGQIAAIQMGQSPPGDTYNANGKGLPFFQGKAEFGAETPTTVKWCSQPSRIAETGDILLSVRAPVGPTNFASERCCIGRGLAAIRGESSQCNQRYLRYYLKRFEEDIAARGVGSTFMAINRNDIEKLELAVPPLAEQERLVNLLDEADELRKLRTQADTRTAALLPALFNEMFGDPETNAKGWPRMKVKDTVNLINGRAFKPTEWSKSGLPIIRIQNLKNPLAQFNLYEGKFEPKHLVKKGALLIAWAGQLVSFGVHIWEGPEGVLNQHIFKVEPRLEYEINFLQHALSHVVESAKSRFQGSEMKHLTRGTLDEAAVIFPPIKLQKEFAKRVTEIRELEAAQSASRQRLEALFQSMLHRAFNGEL